MKASGAEAFARLQTLEAELRAIGDQRAQIPFSEAAHYRISSQRALAAVVDFIDGDQGSNAENLSEPLVRLMTAVDYIERGGYVGWLTPGSPGRPPLPTEIETMRPCIAAVIEWLMNVVQPPIERKPAAERVLRQLGQERASALLARTGRKNEPVKWEEVARWREIVMRSSDSDGLFAYQYHLRLNQLIAIFGADVTRADAEQHCKAIIEGIVKRFLRAKTILRKGRISPKV